jgi:hypothetical protein
MKAGRKPNDSLTAWSAFKRPIRNDQWLQYIHGPPAGYQLTEWGSVPTIHYGEVNLCSRGQGGSGKEEPRAVLDDEGIELRAESEIKETPWHPIQ